MIGIRRVVGSVLGSSRLCRKGKCGVCNDGAHTAPGEGCANVWVLVYLSTYQSELTSVRRVWVWWKLPARSCLSVQLLCKTEVKKHFTSWAAADIRVHGEGSSVCYVHCKQRNSFVGGCVTVHACIISSYFESYKLLRISQSYVYVTHCYRKGLVVCSSFPSIRLPVSLPLTVMRQRQSFRVFYHWTLIIWTKWSVGELKNLDTAKSSNQEVLKRIQNHIKKMMKNLIFFIFGEYVILGGALINWFCNFSICSIYDLLYKERFTCT